MSEIIFKPIIPLQTMIIITSILLVITLINRKHIINRILILALLFIISQRPMLPNQAGPTYKLDLNVIFVIDNTVSMNAVDVNNNTRLKAVINDCKYIMDKLIGSEFAIINYSNISQVKLPFTMDINAASNVLDSMIVIDPEYANGSSLSAPYNDLKDMLEIALKKEDHKTVVFFMSDGEENVSGNKFNIYNSIKSLIHEGAILGYGTLNGSKIKVSSSINKNLVDKDNCLLDMSKNPPVTAISKLNENSLKEIANYLNLDYYHMTHQEVIDTKIKDINEVAIKHEENNEYSDKDLYYYFSIALLVLLIYELYYYRRNEQ